MISYGKQSINNSDIESVLEVLQSDWLTQGPIVEKFEDDLKNYFGTKYACVVSSGTAALHLVGLALGWSKNDIILTSPITFLATANSIVYTGATPDFVDIDPISYTIDISLLEKKILSYKKKKKVVKAIIGVDYAGHPCDWKKLREIANKYDLQLINDNCHALGSEYYNSKKYALEYADIVTQSYHPVKHITTGEGGSILTNNKSIDYKVRLLRTHGILKEKDKIKHNGPWYYEMHEIGYNYRITDFQCALGISQLKRLDEFVNKRIDIATRYNNLFLQNELFTIPFINKHVKHSYHLYPLKINFSKCNISKKELFLKLSKKDIYLQVHYIPITMQPFYIKNYNIEPSDYLNSNQFYDSVLSLPIYNNLTINQQNYVFNNILKLVS